MEYLKLDNNIKLYHGSDCDIEKFSIEQAENKLIGIRPFQGCLFFTLNKEYAKMYGKKIYTVSAKDMTFLNLGNIEQVEKFADYFLNEIEEIFNNECLCRPWIKKDDFIYNCLSVNGYIVGLSDEIIELAEGEGEEIPESSMIKIKEAILNILPDFIIDCSNIYSEFMLIKKEECLKIENIEG